MSGKDGNGSCRTAAPGPRRHEPGAPGTAASGRQCPGGSFSARPPSQPRRREASRVKGPRCRARRLSGAQRARGAGPSWLDEEHGWLLRGRHEGAGQGASGMRGGLQDPPRGPRVTSNADGRGRIQPRQRGQLCHRAAPEKANWPASVSSQPKTGGPLSRCAEGTVVTGRLRPKPADDLLFYSPRAKNGFYVFIDCKKKKQN